jgi:HPt (histidine-containing phosphotransfer) domain-containing protein
MEWDTTEIGQVMNLAGAVGQMEGDTELLREIVEIFMETAPEQLQAIENAIAAGDAARVALVAHGMKGGASNFCADRFVAAARELELTARNGDLAAAPQLLARMREGYSDLDEVAAVINWDELHRNWHC